MPRKMDMLAALITAVVILSTTQTTPSSEALAEDAPLGVIVHRESPLSRIEPALLKQIFTAQLLYWPDGTSVVPLNYPPGDPLRAAFDKAVLGMTPDGVSEYWIDQMVRARAQPPRKIANPHLVLRIVAQFKGAIGYVPESMVTADVKLIAVVKGGKVVTR